MKDPVWKKPTADIPLERVSRLEARYQLLCEIIVDQRASMSQRDPEAHALAPSAEVYLGALALETRNKTFDQMTQFVDEQLQVALSNYSSDHPIKVRLKKLYQQGVEALFPQIVDKVTSGVPFEVLMTFLASERMRLAEQACDVPTYKFGLPRGGPKPSLARTIYAVGGRFDAYREAMVALVPRDRRDFTVSPSFDAIVGSEGVSQLRGMDIVTTIHGKQIPISTLLVCDQPPNNPQLIWLFTERTDMPVTCPVAALIHADAAYLDVIRDYCAELYGTICHFSGSKEQLIELIATLQWHLAHAMFYFRGSAAIAEWLCRALFYRHGYEVMWEQQPDLQALSRVVAIGFVHNYSVKISMRR